MKTQEPNRPVDEAAVEKSRGVVRPVITSVHSGYATPLKSQMGRNWLPQKQRFQTRAHR